MNLNDLIGLADIKEIQAKALIDIYKDKVSNKELQQMIDNYCDNMSTTFLETYKEDLKNNQLTMGLRNYILNIKADKPHSGYRFYEALYRKLNEPAKTNEEVGLIEE